MFQFPPCGFILTLESLQSSSHFPLSHQTKYIKPAATLPFLNVSGTELKISHPFVENEKGEVFMTNKMSLSYKRSLKPSVILATHPLLI